MENEIYSVYAKLFNKISTRRLKNPEDILSHNVAIWLRNQVLDGWPIVFFHVPNENYTTATYAMKTNTIGRIPGAPDFVIVSPNKTVFLELKAPGRKAKLSDKQQAFQKWSDFVGIPYRVVSTVEEVRKTLFKEFSGIANLSILSDA